MPQADLGLPAYRCNGSTSSAGVAAQWRQWVCDPQDYGAACCRDCECGKAEVEAGGPLGHQQQGAAAGLAFWNAVWQQPLPVGLKAPCGWPASGCKAACVLNAAACAIWTFSSSLLALSVSPSLLGSPPPASSLTEQLGRHWDSSSDINLSWCGMRGINIQRVM